MSNTAKASPKSGVIGIRLDKQILRVIDAVAKKEGRSRTKQIEQILKDSIANAPSPACPT